MASICVVRPRSFSESRFQTSDLNGQPLAKGTKSDAMRGESTDADTEWWNSDKDRAVSNGKFRKHNPKGLNGLNGGEFDRYGKRFYDRHSGTNKTGLKAVEKRSGAGSHNWGTILDIINNELNSSTETAGLPRNSKSISDQAPVRRSSLTQQQLTLDEWKTMEQHQIKKQFDVRQPGEGCDIDPMWTTMHALEKKYRESQQKADDHHFTKQQQQPVVMVTVNFKKANDDESESRDDQNNDELVPNVHSDSDFPILN